MKIAVAVSGGIDSLYALTALSAAGHEVLALHARFTDAPSDPVPGLDACCSQLGIPLHVEDLRREFRRGVIRSYVGAHVRALTPNPCAQCNRLMKFGRLLGLAESLGAEKLATGHYACLEPNPAYGVGQFLRSLAGNPKDQSYFLSLVPIGRLQRVLFPLAGLRKEEIRTRMGEKGLEPPVPGESQDICFVPRDDYRSFLQKEAVGNTVRLGGPGPVVLWDTGAVIARHDGLWRYTEGQRKGLGIPWSEPLYVLRRDSISNTLFVATKRFIMTETATAGEINCLVPPALWPDELFVRTRFRQPPVRAKVSIHTESRPEAGQIRTGIGGIASEKPGSEEDAATLSVRFSAPQEPHAPGQVLAVYDAGGFILAGGILTA
ncbi:MAG: tRNA-specific 2-thiouridylase [Mailhella sp.]|nr:tRNA-specific 2-thiouridylase [Mailhella sp.]